MRYRSARARAARTRLGQPPAPAPGARPARGRRPRARRVDPGARRATAERARAARPTRWRPAASPSRSRPTASTSGSTCPTTPTASPRALAERGFQVRPSSAFAVGGPPRHALRVTTATLTPDQAEAFAGRSPHRDEMSLPMFTGLSAFPLTPARRGRRRRGRLHAAGHAARRRRRGLDRAARQHRQLRVPHPRGARAGRADRRRRPRRRARDGRDRRPAHARRAPARARRPGRRRVARCCSRPSPTSRSPTTRSSASTTDVTRRAVGAAVRLRQPRDHPLHVQRRAARADRGGCRTSARSSSPAAAGRRRPVCARWSPSTSRSA